MSKTYLIIPQPTSGRSTSVFQPVKKRKLEQNYCSTCQQKNTLLSMKQFLVEKLKQVENQLNQLPDCTKEHQSIGPQLLSLGNGVMQGKFTANVVVQNREWKTQSMNEQLKNVKVQLLCKTRTEKAVKECPETLYCSIKYEIRIECIGNELQKIPFLLARIYLVPEDQEFPTKSLDGVEGKLKGKTESALTHLNDPDSKGSACDDRLEGTLKIQMINILRNKNKKYCLEVHMFVPTDLMNPAIVSRSAPFKAYARKPNKRKYSAVEQDK